VGCLKKQVAIEVSGVEWLRKEPISIEFEMGIGLILADQEKVELWRRFFEVPIYLPSYSTERC